MDKIIYIKVPVIMNTTSLSAKSDVVKRFGKNIYAGIVYGDELTTNQRIKVICDQFEIIKVLEMK